MCRSLLHLDNDYIYESSLSFLFKQLDLYIKHNKIDKNNKNVSNTKANKNSTEKVVYKITDDD